MVVRSHILYHFVYGRAMLWAAGIAALAVAETVSKAAVDTMDTGEGSGTPAKSAKSVAKSVVALERRGEMI